MILLKRGQLYPLNLNFIHTPELISTWLIIKGSKERGEGKHVCVRGVGLGVVRERERGRGKKG